MTPPENPASPGGLVYAALAADQIAGAYRVKASLEARAVTLVTTAGTLVTVALAISAFARTGDSHSLPAVARSFVAIAVVCFAGSLYFAFEILRPSSHTNATTDGLRELVEDDWEDSQDMAAKRVAMFHAEALDEIRTRNSKKADNLHKLVTGELVAVAMLALAVIFALVGD